MAQPAEFPPIGRAIMRTLPVADVRPGRYQPRTGPSLDDLGSLIDSVRVHGLLEPILVRPVAGHFELVAGERRWRAACAAGLAEVPAVVRELSDRDAAVLALVENLQRADLQFFEEAEAFRSLVDEFRLSQQELAAQLGLSQPAVANKLRLLRLEPAVREAVLAAALGERHARALLALADEATRLQAVETFASRGWTARQAEEWAAGRTSDRGPARPRRRAAAAVPSHLSAFEQAVRDLERSGYPAELTAREDEGGWTLRVRVRRPTADADPQRGHG